MDRSANEQHRLTRPHNCGKQSLIIPMRRVLELRMKSRHQLTDMCRARRLLRVDDITDILNILRHDCQQSCLARRMRATVSTQARRVRSEGARRLTAIHRVDVSKCSADALATSSDVLAELEARPCTSLRGLRGLPGPRGPRGPHLPVYAPDFTKIRVRDYQMATVQQAHRKSGFIVAPCASGKTLMGLMLACLNGGQFLILTTRYAEQWKLTLDTFFVPIGKRRVFMYGCDDARTALFDPPDVVIATYSRFAAPTADVNLRSIRQLQYTSVVLDEAHGAAAPTIIKSLERIHSYYKIPLTATPVREDNLLQELDRIVGGTIVTIDRKEMEEQGHVARVTCLNLVVPYDDCLERETDRSTALALHPCKMQVLCSTLQRLVQDGNKTIVFCDILFCLSWAFQCVQEQGLSVVGCISMTTSQEDRVQCIRDFTSAPPGAIMFISRTGDEALDVPAATAGVVFCNLWASRRQIVQRIGRISRISASGPAPTFVVLISDDAKELEITQHRVTYLEEHGFAVTTAQQSDSVYGVKTDRDTPYVHRLKLAWSEQKSEGDSDKPLDEPELE